VRTAYRKLYKQLLLENPVEAREKYQGQVRAALAAYAPIRRSVRYLLYPLLMKLFSDRFIPDEEFFVRTRKRLRRKRTASGLGPNAPTPSASAPERSRRAGSSPGDRR